MMKRTTIILIVLYCLSIPVALGQKVSEKLIDKPPFAALVLDLVRVSPDSRHFAYAMRVEVRDGQYK